MAHVASSYFVASDYVRAYVSLVSLGTADMRAWMILSRVGIGGGAGHFSAWLGAVFLGL